MRRYIFLFAMLSLFVIGCSEQSSVLAPVNNVNTNEPNWVSLPSQENGLSVNSGPRYEKSKWINGEAGGQIMLSEEYPSGPFGIIKVRIKLIFPAGAFTGDKRVTIKIDEQTGTTTFLPHSIFDAPALYTASFEGLDLSNVNLNNVDFVYKNDDNNQYEKIDRSYLELDPTIGKLKVKDAKLKHFSRYGFVN